MNLRWSGLDKMRDELPLTKEDHQSIAYEAFHAWLRSPKALIAYFSLMGFCIASSSLTTWAIGSIASGLSYWKEMIGMVLFIPVFIAGMGVIKRFGYSQVLYSVLRARGFDVCLKCGYDLRATQHETCPECGWRREVVS